MPDVEVFLLAVASIGIGWVLGRYAGRQGKESGAEVFPASYYKGLNYLINQQSDQGIEAFVDSLEVNSTTLETHIALGNLMRRKGEVERAILIHQNLLGRSSLNRNQQQLAHFELARDYQKAGLLDRAERLLLDLVSEAPEHRVEALTLLVDIYDEEREWQQAIETGQQLLPRRRIGQRNFSQTTMAHRLAYYSCELALLASAEGDDQEANKLLERAFSFDRACVRAGMLQADYLREQDHPRRAIKGLERVVAQNPRFIGVVLPVLARCYETIDDLPAMHQYLRGFLEGHASTLVVLRMVEDLLVQGKQLEATQLLAQQMSRHPTLEGMARLIQLSCDDDPSSPPDALQRLRQLVLQMGEQKPRYRCDDCGFAGRQLHWQCPSCRNWQTVAPISGLEGD